MFVAPGKSGGLDAGFTPEIRTGGGAIRSRQGGTFSDFGNYER